MTTRHTTHPTVLGEVTLVASGDEVTGVYFPHHWYAPATETFGPRVDASHDVLLRRAADEIDEYFAGTRTAFGVPHTAAGDAFQSRVWELVAAIPYGQVRTYGELAADLNRDGWPADITGATSPDAPLAKMVGQAVGRNPLCLIVPCHRVVGAGGKVIGYAGGVDRKRHLLELEAPTPAAAGRLF